MGGGFRVNGRGEREGWFGLCLEGFNEDDDELDEPGVWRRVLLFEEGEAW
jgi:hypothetical protein